jgi:hypothetical protein
MRGQLDPCSKKKKIGHNFDNTSDKGKKGKFTLDKAMKAQKGVEV